MKEVEDEFNVPIALSAFRDKNDERKETSEHYILHCPRLTYVRDNTILKLPVNLINICNLLQGDPNLSNNVKSLIFKAVQGFIIFFGRFAVELQT